MNILAVDTSAKVTSVAVVCESGVLAEFNANTKLTHSQTLMPMIDGMLSCAKLSLDQIDCFAAAVGPGSFTGLRIGIGAIKGLAYGKQKPCIGISTLEGLAYNLKGMDGILCAVMDARCNQVYNALFEGSSRLSADRAISIDDLQKDLLNYKKNIFFVGDGADLCYNGLVQKTDRLFLASDLLKYQKAASIGLLALEKLSAPADSVAHQQSVSAGELMPVYLRLPQAQRELLKRNAQTISK